MGPSMYQVLCCGSNGAGQLGLGHEEDLSELVETFQTESKVTQIACGSNHTVILLENGDAYACGNNTKQLVNSGNDVELNTGANEPHNPIIETLHKFERVGDGSLKFTHCAAGWDFSVLVDQSNTVYIYGDLKQCGGLGKDVHNAKELTEVYQSLNDDVLSVHTSLHTVIIIHQSGRMITWGNNKKGQILGDCETSSMIWEPCDIRFDDITIGKEYNLAILHCAMGRDYTFFHVKDRNTDNAYLIMRCKNDRYNIFQGLFELIGEKEKVGTVGKTRTRWFSIKHGTHIHQLESMWSSIHVIYSTENERASISSFGNNVFSQIFPGSPEPIDKFVVGTEHGIGITTDKKTAFSWGWGEHGNCGEQKEPKKVNELYHCSAENEYIDSMFGGYATTWIVVKM